jgi:WS/DGAT/MGAT family acyltransferase
MVRSLDPAFPPADRSMLRSLAPALPAPVTHATAPVAQATAAGARAARAGMSAALHPRNALSRARSLTDLIVRDEIIPAPRTSLNAPIGSTRRFAVVRVPLDELKEIRQRLGGSINDVVLAACTTGLRELLIERGDRLPTRGLRAMVPVNVRSAAQTLSLGNRLSSLFVNLPVALGGPAARHTRLVTGTRRLKRSDAAAGATAVIDLAAVAPPVVHGVIARSLYATRLFNVTITNVPGPQMPLYALGARLREVHPVVPLAADHTVGIAVFSYDGLVTFGVIADSESTPDIDVLAYGIENGIDELIRLSRGRTQLQAK